MAGAIRRRFALLRRLAPALVLAILAGCSTLPAIAPDMAPADPESVQFKTVSGRILSPEQTKAVLARLSDADENPDSLARHLALEQEVSGSPLSLGNRVVLLENGPDTYAAMLSAIAAAGNHINMETYILEDDEAGRRFADALIAKQAQGVQVNLIRDSVGTLRTPKDFREALLHAKTAVIDDVWVTVGSTNLDWRSFLHNQELTAVILGSEFGAKMREAFERDLAVSNQITLRAWRGRGVGTRTKEWFGRLWEYWL